MISSTTKSPKTAPRPTDDVTPHLSWRDAEVSISTSTTEGAFVLDMPTMPTTDVSSLGTLLKVT